MGCVEDVGQEVKVAWQPLLEQWYRTQPDGGTHSASKWALQQWDLGVPQIEDAWTHRQDRAWLVTKQTALTMIQVPGGILGEQGSDRKQEVKISPFHISDCEISVELFNQFMSDMSYEGAMPLGWRGADREVSPSLAHPVQQINWYDAAMFCNWLSWKEDLDPCYAFSKAAPDLANRNLGRNEASDVEIDADANGFRMPTEAQWEHACRAGTNTRFSFGDDDAWLARYGVYAGNSNSHTRAVGSRACNPWGLFDLHGNVWEWCEDTQDSYRVYRGGSWGDAAWYCESPDRSGLEPSYRNFDLGFRVALVLSAVEQASGAESGSR